MAVATPPMMDLLHRQPRSEAPWLQALRAELMAGLHHEAEVTMQVAVCVAAKMNRTEIVHSLAVSELEVKMAMQRLEGVASKWRNET